MAHMVRFPAERRYALQPQAVRFFKVDEQHADLAGLADVAHGQEHAVAVVAGEQDGPAVDDFDKAGVAAFVGDGGSAVVVYRGEEEHVPALYVFLVAIVHFVLEDDALNGIGQFSGVKFIL